MKKTAFAFVFGAIMFPALAKVSARSGEYEGRAHFIIATASATYFLDKSSGGISRMIDRDDHDWIAYKNHPWNEIPASAASSFRGIPNLVFQGDQGGVGHPGWNKCVTTSLNDSTFLVKDFTGKWVFEWHFTDVHASLTMLHVDNTRTYWFLYEGPVGGRFAPQKQYWATDVDGIRKDTPNIFDVGSPARGNWRWVYFGDSASGVILFVVQETRDEQPDFFAYMGNSKTQDNAEDRMVVFGFGRSGKPLLSTSGNRFIIGFMEGVAMSNKSYNVVKARIETFLE